MKKILCIYLSFSMAFLPFTSHAQNSTTAELESTSRVEELIQKKTSSTEKLLKNGGIRILDAKTKKETSFKRALRGNSIIIDATSIHAGWIQLKGGSIDFERNELTIHLAKLRSLEDTSPVDTTSITVNFRQSKEEIIQSALQSLQNLNFISPTKKIFFIVSGIIAISIGTLAFLKMKHGHTTKATTRSRVNVLSTILALGFSYSAVSNGSEIVSAALQL